MELSKATTTTTRIPVHQGKVSRKIAAKIVLTMAGVSTHLQASFTRRLFIVDY